jgi:hypothetical protein
LAAPAGAEAPKDTKGLFVERRLGVPPSAVLAAKLSRDGLHVAILAKRGDRQYVVVDGQAGPEYDRVGKGSPFFSPEGNHVVYVANKDKMIIVVVDGQAGMEYDVIFQGGPTFRPDGTLEFLAIRDNVLYRVDCAPQPKR